MTEEQALEKIELLIQENGQEALKLVEEILKAQKQTISELNRQILSQPHLVNRGDGVNGHYCIGRFNLTKNCVEYYNKDCWSGCGMLYIEKEIALLALFKLQIAHLMASSK